MEIFKQVVDALMDRSRSIGFKTSVVITSIAIIFALDYLTGFSYNYYLGQKFAHIEKIQAMKIIYKENPEAQKIFEKMEAQLLHRQHYSEAVSGIFLRNPEFRAKHDLSLTSSGSVDARSRFWMILTSSYFFIAVMFPLLYLPFAGQVHRTGPNLVGWFSLVVTLCFIIAFFTWIGYQIPLIWGRPIWNYILNFLLHSTIPIFVYWISRQSTAPKFIS